MVRVGVRICIHTHTHAQRRVDASPWLRTTQIVSTRSPDPPNLPPGPAHRLADNYYFSRDLRRAVQPPTMVSSYKQLTESSEAITRYQLVSFPDPQYTGLGTRLGISR